ncbi:MAG: type II secretion system protein [bacterium]|nr:type II secretion system protein [bacterium]MDZ4285244.1 type II secretion system protein [Patescibacteria group bacterium]
MRFHFPKRGFTLIETIVALAVLLAAITGTLTLFTQGLEVTGLARGTITAFYLAQEPIEYIRRVRDENRLALIVNGEVRDWLLGVRAACVDGAPCTVDVANDTIVSCGGVCSVLLARADGIYNYDTGAPSGFTRTTTVTETIIGARREALIDVVVSWNRGNIARSFRLKETIMNW